MNTTKLERTSARLSRRALTGCCGFALGLVIAAAMQAPVHAAPLTSLPLAAQPGRMPLRPTTWDAMWDVTWQRAAYYHRIDVATTAEQDPTCQGNLGIDVIVKNTILAVSLRKSGDAARFMSQFQDVTQCLTREGARGVEFALAMYVHRAITVLPPAQAQIAVQGVLNLGMQMFDELQYTGQSWWLMMVNIDNAKIQSLMVTYPRRDLALWLYDFDRGMMVQSSFQDGLDRLIWSMQRIDNFGLGACNLLNMSATGFVCPDKGAAGGGSKGGAAGMMAPPGGIPTSGVSCVIASVRPTGVRGQFACLSKAIAGIVFDPRTAGADLAKQASQQPGIRDKFCALSAEGDTTTATDTTTTTTTTKEPTKWDKVKDAVGKVKDVVVSVVTAIFDKTPPVIDTLGQGASAEGADAVRGGLQANQEFKARESLFTDDGYEDYAAKRAGRVTTDPQANKRTITGDGTQTGGGCGAGSNAAARAKTMYQCTMGSDMNPRNPGAGMGGVKNSGGFGPNPTIALFDPSQAAGPLPGAMSCQMQGGDLARASLNDQHCANMRCMQGEVCACNSPGGLPGGQPAEIRVPLKADIECVDGPCVGVGRMPPIPIPPPPGGRNKDIGPVVPPPSGGPVPGAATAPIPDRPK